jgi:pyrimidine-specific ribonucleoside hydrolase
MLSVLLFCHEQAWPATEMNQPEAVWIDTDPACGLEATDDVDDCWALLAAFKSPEIVVRGISTVFGNVDCDTAHLVASDFIRRSTEEEGVVAPAIFRGASEKCVPGSPRASEASHAISAALQSESLTIIALGPLTNIATVLELNPELTQKVKRVIAIAGNRPGGRRFWFQKKPIHFHDLNFKKDPGAFEIVLASGIPVTLLPFEAAQQVTITAEDLDQAADIGGTMGWLAESSRGWLRFWEKSLGERGFYPFDSLAVMYVVLPELYFCEQIPARVVRRRSRFVVRDELAVSENFTEGTSVSYCTKVDKTFKDHLLVRLGVPEVRREKKEKVQ